MGIYLCIFAILLICSYIETFGKFNSSYKKQIIALIILIYIILSVCYNGPMGDYFSYEDAFINTDTNHIPDLIGERFEFLYSLLSLVVRSFTGSYKVFRLVLALIVMPLWYKIYTDDFYTFNNRYNFTIMLVVWALTFGYIYIARSTIAFALCIFGFRYVIQRKPLEFFFCTIIAIGFHTLSLVWLPVYFIYGKNFNEKKWHLILMGLIVLLMLLGSSINRIVLFVNPLLEKIPVFGEYISSKVLSYIDRGITENYGGLFDYFVMLIKAYANMAFIMIIGLFSINATKRKRFCDFSLMRQSKPLAIQYNQFLIGGVFYVIALNTSMAFTRVAGIFTLFECFIIPSASGIITSLQAEQSKKKFIYITMVAYLFLRMTMYYFGYDHGTFF